MFMTPTNWPGLKTVLVVSPESPKCATASTVPVSTRTKSEPRSPTRQNTWPAGTLFSTPYRPSLAVWASSRIGNAPAKSSSSACAPTRPSATVIGTWGDSVVFDRAWLGSSVEATNPAYVRLRVKRRRAHMRAAPHCVIRSGSGDVAGRGIDHGGQAGDLVGREAAAAGVLQDDVRIRGDVDAVELVVGDVAVEPVDLGPQVGDDLVGLLRDRPQLLGGKAAGPRQVALDHKLRHLPISYLVTYSWYGAFRTVGTEVCIPLVWKSRP